MLYFRSEEHIDNWCRTWSRSRGAVIPIADGWRLAQAWYGEDRRDPAWRRRTAAEAQELLSSLGFDGEFWAFA